MFYFAIRSLWGRRVSYSFVLLELTIGFLSLMFALTSWRSMTEVARRTQAVAANDVIAAQAFNCPAQHIASAAASLAAHPAVAIAGTVYPMQEVTLAGSGSATIVALDAGAAQMTSLRLQAGRWFTAADFTATDASTPVILGDRVQPELTVGDSVPGYPNPKLVVIGRLAPAQHFWGISHSRAIDSIAPTDALILTTTALVRANAQATGLKSDAKIIVKPQSTDTAAIRTSLQSGEAGACLNGVETIAEGVEQYYADRRPVVFVMSTLAIVVLSIGVLGFAGIAMVLVDRRSREFAIRLAVGATAGQLAYQVVWEMTILTLCATVIGTPMGYLLAERLEQSLTLWDWVVVLVLAASVGLIASLGPVLAILRRPPASFVRNG